MEPTAQGYGVMWTQQEHDRAVDLWRAKVSVTRIAHVMGRTRGSVAGRLRRAGVLGTMKTSSGNRALKARYPMPSRIAQIVSDMSEEKAIPVNVVLSNNVQRHVSSARHDIMRHLRDNVVMRDGKPPSYPLIGGWFGRDHSSIIYAVKKARAA